MAKISPISGFPEWLPQQRQLEQYVIDTFRKVSELHGFVNIETRAVEPMDQLLRKGEIDKEVYVISRLNQTDKDTQLGLHFDLTVPLARYVLENQNALDFPFRRYQIQKVWRGERPQDGRFREFYQADIDIIGQNTLPAHLDADVAIVMAEVLSELPLPGFTISINNRRLSQAVFNHLGIEDFEGVLRQLDKLAKIGPDAVKQLLIEQAGLSVQQAERCLEFASIKAEAQDLKEQVSQIASGEKIDEALDELVFVLESITASKPGIAIADLSIARGLDYYTGTVFETFVHGHEDLGSICSGGRYDQLAQDNRHTYPGVGLSIGLSRLVSRMVSKNMVTTTRKVPTAVLVAVNDESMRMDCVKIANTLRARGISTEVAPFADKFGKQIRYADRRLIPFVWFPVDQETGEVKDIRSGEQIKANIYDWMPESADLKVQIQTNN